MSSTRMKMMLGAAPRRTPPREAGAKIALRRQTIDRSCVVLISFSRGFGCRQARAGFPTTKSVPESPLGGSLGIECINFALEFQNLRGLGRAPVESFADILLQIEKERIGKRNAGVTVIIAGLRENRGVRLSRALYERLPPCWPTPCKTV